MYVFVCGGGAVAAWEVCIIIICFSLHFWTNTPPQDRSYHTTDIQGRSQNLCHFLSRHGAQIGGIWFLTAVKITLIRQVSMYCSLSVKINMCETCVKHPKYAKIADAFCLCLFDVWLAKKKPKPPIWTTWLMMASHGVAYEVWDLPYLCTIPTIATAYKYCWNQ